MADRVEPTGGAPDPNRGSKEQQFRRLAEALRENLQKRKRQQRAREEREGGDDPSLVPCEEHLADFEA